MGRIDLENSKPVRQAMDIIVTVGDIRFSNKDIISCNVYLRGLKRNLASGTFSIEGSEIEIEAIVKGDSDYWTNWVCQFDDGELITYTSGYINDEMSKPREFYMRDASYDSQSSVIKLKGCDNTVYRLENDFNGFFKESTFANVRIDYYDAIKCILDEAGVAYEEAGTVPSGTGLTPTNIYIAKGKSRDIIAKACGLYRNGLSLSITYRDAGRPQLIAGNSVVLWELDEAQIASLETETERNVKEYDVNLESYVIGEVEELASLSDGQTGVAYIEETDYAIYSISSTENCTAELIGMHSIKITPTQVGEGVESKVYGQKIVAQTLSSDAPKVIKDELQKGIIVELGALPKLTANKGSITALAIADMLQESPVSYTFKYRGDPRMQPGDLLRIHRISAGTLFPGSALMPGNEVMPIRGNTLDLRIETLSLEHREGGLTSAIEARVATIYEAPGILYPGADLYPNIDVFPE